MQELLDTNINRREFFRLNTMQACQFRLTSINGRSVALEKIGQGKLLNLSAGGALLECSYDLSVENGFTIGLSFELKEEWFYLESRVIRREPVADEFQYGLEFINMPDKEQKRLQLTLSKLQLTKARHAKK